MYYQMTKQDFHVLARKRRSSSSLSTNAIHRIWDIFEKVESEGKGVIEYDPVHMVDNWTEEGNLCELSEACGIDFDYDFMKSCKVIHILPGGHVLAHVDELIAAYEEAHHEKK